MRLVTYSPAFTLVPTYECFNRCSYCNFRTDPKQDLWLTLDKAREILTSLQGKEVTEILILSGEVHPQSNRRKDWLKRIYDIAHLALSMGFFPHSNVGPLSYEEMALLKTVNASMGLMVEQVNPSLLDTVHRFAPSKVPQLRLQQLEWAGMLQIPFTTGILLGIGESSFDRMESIRAIALIQEKYGHIQEVILQPYSKGSKDSYLQNNFNNLDLLETINNAKKILPNNITVQIPPNLIQDEKVLIQCLELGVRDLGGIVPKDEVNPNYSHDNLTDLKNTLLNHGWILKPRLPVYPQYYQETFSRLKILCN
ncbi:7,8-didemethyl-8-hydroxy-5-deazariboflavin synthase subunit CofG [Cyanobacterium stanieri LEGE 03274]|uniref:7,8-didemethyl-8-hydroxy-5-deazariboflavin synthase n=1 Tax=Cyanobacterium stanieri LEGE 03274 TaxID=1828756 RepID=A0ABR9V3S9_9CHRO|nr:7,8-didemethyl-8-hydroxy-5-deazariboflavin synthase subunit CofG [Cyanobacterium stanieri]MBE9222204.1 7,8-didemethyl-8-hydroxy-5-deazariboflavin synthase subunit CofG [Cyanobacterium stanieri LEGE 03274]